MLINFFFTLRAAKLKVSVKEYLMLLEAIKGGVMDADEHDPSGPTVDKFYYLARTSLVKDEANFDKFDRAFAAYFKGVEMLTDFDPGSAARLAAEEARTRTQRRREGRDREDGLGRADGDAQEALRGTEGAPRRRQQAWIGTGGTSPFGAYGYNPQGIRIGQDKLGATRAPSRSGTSAQYKDYDDTLELGTRNIKVALRRLRRFAREGSERSWTWTTPSASTAANAGWLDIKMVPERHNKVKVLLLMDVGGTMDEHIHRVEEIFSAAKTEFKHLEFYYFHNCVYDFMWKNNRRRFSEKFATWDIIRKYNKDYKLIFVGDATMSPYEILQPAAASNTTTRSRVLNGWRGSRRRSRSSPGSTPSRKACGAIGKALRWSSS